MMKLVPSFPDFIRKLPEVDLPIPGARGWLLQGQDQQAVFIEFEKTVEVPEHSHSAQWEFALAGQVELKLGGKILTHNAGENFHIPAGTPHGATVHAGYKAMMVFNEPGRYKSKA